MKALVLAGGTGVRLRPVSHTMPKQLVPVANVPVLHHGLTALCAAGISEVGIVVSDEGGRAIADSVGDGSAFGLAVTYIHQERPLGLAHCVLIAREFLGDDDFVMYLGDNVVPGGVAALLDCAGRHPAAVTVLVGPVKDPTECGVAEVADDGRVLGLEEKSQTPRSDLAMIGIYVFGPAIHEAVRAITPSSRAELEITQAIQWLVERGADVRACRFDGFWRDTGRLANLLDCNREMLLRLGTDIRGKVDDESLVTGGVLLGEGAAVLRSHLVGPLTVGPNSVISDSYVGPFTSIGADCVLEDTDIHDSIVLSGAALRGARNLRGSLIGRRASLRSRSGPGAGRQVVVGDDSVVVDA